MLDHEAVWRAHQPRDTVAMQRGTVDMRHDALRRRELGMVGRIEYLHRERRAGYRERGHAYLSCQFPSSSV